MNAIKKEVVLDDLRMVGDRKAVGHLSIEQIKECGKTVEEFTSKDENGEIRTFICENYGVEYGKECLHKYHYKAAEKILQRDASLIESAGWSTDPDEYIKGLTRGRVPKSLKRTTDNLFGVYPEIQRLTHLPTREAKEWQFQSFKRRTGRSHPHETTGPVNPLYYLSPDERSMLSPEDAAKVNRSWGIT